MISSVSRKAILKEAQMENLLKVIEGQNLLNMVIEILSARVG